MTAGLTTFGFRMMFQLPVVMLSLCIGHQFEKRLFCGICLNCVPYYVDFLYTIIKDFLLCLSEMKFVVVKKKRIGIKRDTIMLNFRCVKFLVLPPATPIQGQQIFAVFRFCACALRLTCTILA